MADSYRMKPLVTVEAMQVVAEARNADLAAENDEGPPGNMEQVAEWMGSSVTVGHDRMFEVAVPDGRFGPRYARGGDWIVKEAEGVFHVVDSETFDDLYVPAGQS